MPENRITLQQNLADAGCDENFILRFAVLAKAQNTAEMLKMLATQRQNLLDSVHREERRIYCLDYLVCRLKMHTQKS